MALLIHLKKSLMFSPDIIKANQNYCSQIASPEGSNLYYANLFESEETRIHIVGFHALHNELFTILSECSDPGIAHIKFQWWLEEIQRLSNQEARHPVTQYLQNHRLISTDITSELQVFITTTEKLLLIERPNNLNDALKLFANNSGLIWQRCAKQNHIEQTVSLDCIKQLGTNYHYLMALTEASTFLVDRCNILPKDNKFKTKDMIEHIKSDIRNLIQSLPKKDSLKFRHGILMSHLAVAMTKKMMNQGYPWSPQHVSLSPIKKLGLAWCQNHLLGIRN